MAESVEGFNPLTGVTTNVGHCTRHIRLECVAEETHYLKAENQKNEEK